MIQRLFTDTAGLHIRFYRHTIAADAVLGLIVLLMLRAGFRPILVPIHFATDRFDCLKKGFMLKEHIIVDDI